MAYNARGGALAGLRDMLHKALSPGTYPCNLCAITYGPLGMRAAWRRTLGATGLEPLFLHREDLPPGHPPLPFLALGTAEAPQLLVEAHELRGLDLQGLSALLLSRLTARGLAPEG